MVVVYAFVSGTLGAVIAATGAFLLHDFLFTHPHELDPFAAADRLLDRGTDRA